jgi:hypothetical protein
MDLKNQSTVPATATITSADDQEIPASIPAQGSKKVDLASYQGPFKVAMSLEDGPGGTVYGRDQYDTVIIRQDGSVVAESG